MKKIILTAMLFVLNSNIIYADCITGYACSISELKEQNNIIEKQFINELNDYFELNINEDFMLGNIKKDLKYKDFFPYTIILNF